MKKRRDVFRLGSDDYVVELGTITHLNMNQDTELAVRFTSGIKNGDEFFTDLNGFQVIAKVNLQRRITRQQLDACMQIKPFFSSFVFVLILSIFCKKKAAGFVMLPSSAITLISDCVSSNYRS
jgi:hypothetical protein